MKQLVFWTGMTFYGATVITCVVAALWAWKKHTPVRGPDSVAYLSPLTNIFLGLGFIVSSTTNISHPIRIAYILIGLFQFWPAWIIRNRQRQLSR